MEIQCTEVWGGTGASDVSVMLAGVRGECFARPHEGGEHGGDIHFLSVCGMSILSKVVLADVSGHGDTVAEVSAIIHDALIRNIGAHDNSTMLAAVNDAFMERRTGDFKFTTMASLIIDNRDRSLVYAYAGHPAILCGRAGRFERIRPASDRFGNIPLGVLPAARFEQYYTQLE
ncbi:MAG: PP2C family protein-serine/threonine phosphatase, partial [Planctomycetota bacterium]